MGRKNRNNVTPCKTTEERLKECLNMRGQIKHTDLFRLGNNETVIKDAMNSFVRDGKPDTLKLWADDQKRVRAVIVLSTNPTRMSGVTLEK
jgi:hypothetical protein